MCRKITHTLMAMTLAGSLGATTVPAAASPLLSGAIALKAAAPGDLFDIRYRGRGYYGGAAVAGLAVGLIGALAAGAAYRSSYYGYYGPGYYGGYAPGYYGPGYYGGYAPGYYGPRYYGGYYGAGYYPPAYGYGGYAPYYAPAYAPPVVYGPRVRVVRPATYRCKVRGRHGRVHWARCYR